MGTKKKGTGTSTDVAKWLGAVTEAQANERPTDRVEAMLLEGKRMAQFAGSFASKLAKLPGVDAGLVALTKALALGLEEAEFAWQRARKSVLGGDREKQRKELRALRQRALDTCRFSWRRDPEAMSRLAAIAEGDGSVADLVTDAHTLARELRDDASLVALDGKLAGAADRLEALAEALTEAPEAADADLMRTRNRYAVALGSALDELEAALDFLLRDEKEKRRQYARPRRRTVRKPPPTTPG